MGFGRTPSLAVGFLWERRTGLNWPNTQSTLWDAHDGEADHNTFSRVTPLRFVASPSRFLCDDHLSLEVFVARRREEQLLCFFPPFPICPIHNVKQRVRIVVVHVPNAPDLSASPQIVKLDLEGGNGFAVCLANHNPSSRSVRVIGDLYFSTFEILRIHALLNTACVSAFNAGDTTIGARVIRRFRPRGGHQNSPFGR